jgi:predicted SPOUT superfamily RNA methylase MTH1
MANLFITKRLTQDLSLYNQVKTLLHRSSTLQIARAAAVFCVDEIIVFDEYAKITRKYVCYEILLHNLMRQLCCSEIEAFDKGQWPQPGAKDKVGDCNFLLARILQYLECPQYLRKALFPLQRHLQYAGKFIVLSFRLEYRQSSPV